MTVTGRDVKPNDTFSGLARHMSIERLMAFSGGPLKNAPNWPSVNVHTDFRYAQGTGVPKPCASGTQYLGHVTSLLVDLFGVEWLTYGDMEFKLIKMVLVDSTITPYVRVRHREECADKIRLELDVWVEDQDGDAVLTGTATAHVS